MKAIQHNTLKKLCVLFLVLSFGKALFALAYRPNEVLIKTKHEIPFTWQTAITLINQSLSPDPRSESGAGNHLVFFCPSHLIGFQFTKLLRRRA